MAQVIQGVFPESGVQTKNKPDEPVPSYVLHISLAFSDPLIWRRIQIPGDATLANLHEVIQRSMGWTDSHFHQFIVGKISFEPAMKRNKPRVSKRFDEAKYPLHTLEEGMSFMFSYMYDAGGGWEHLLHLEEVVPPTKPPLKGPILLAGERACPPEEVSDIHEYHDLIAAFETPGSPDYHRFYEMTGRPDFDPAVFNLIQAKKWVEEL